MRDVRMPMFAALAVILLPLIPLVGAEEAATGAKPAEDGKTAKASADLRAALEKLKLPGVKINLEEWCVDVTSSVCLRQGLLELIACTEGTKEHESIVMVEAKPSHIHAALLLIGAKPGNPAMRKPLDEESLRFIDIPPRGCPVAVSLVVGKDKEWPIGDFVAAAGDPEEGGPGAPEPGELEFPDTFLFAGSILHGGGEGARRYLCDHSGNVISISTFGDELLCLPGIHGHANGMLMWEVNGAKLPDEGAPVTLRLRPKVKRPSAAKPAAGTGRD